jgi:hypothetical protein
LKKTCFKVRANAASDRDEKRLYSLADRFVMRRRVLHFNRSMHFSVSFFGLLTSELVSAGFPAPVAPS